VKTLISAFFEVAIRSVDPLGAKNGILLTTFTVSGFVAMIMRGVGLTST